MGARDTYERRREILKGMCGGWFTPRHIPLILLKVRFVMRYADLCYQPFVYTSLLKREVNTNLEELSLVHCKRLSITFLIDLL